MELQIRGVSRTYPNGVRALKDVTLTIPAGMYGLLGPNGAGKSTLMRILATLQEADSGTAMLDDIDVLKDKDAVRRTASLSCSTSIPSRVARPASASCSVARMRISVLFPAPLGPSSPNIPGAMVSDTSRSACTPLG